MQIGEAAEFPSSKRNAVANAIQHRKRIEGKQYRQRTVGEIIKVERTL